MNTRSIKSVAQTYDGPWMKPETLGALPQLKRDFDQNRDPYIAAQLRDIDKTEAERRRESITYNQRHKAPEQDNFHRSRKRRVKEEQSGGDDRGEQDTKGRSSKMIKQDQPKANMRPPEHIARAVDETQFRKSWMREQRDAAMHLAKQDQGDEQTQEQQRSRPGPQIER